MRVIFDAVHFRYPRGGASMDIGSFSMRSGESVALVGPSGAGKTTALRLLGGILTPNRGWIRLGEFCMSSARSKARRAFRLRHIGIVFQDYQLVDCLSVLDNILLPYRLSSSMRLSGEERERASELANKVGLGSKLNCLAHRLSQGERQRCAICRAVVTRPSIILADEPTGALDAFNRARVVDLILDMARECEASVVFVTHDLDVLEPFDRIWDFGGPNGERTPA